MSLDQHQYKRLPSSSIGLTVFGTSFLVYLFTTSPTVYLGDSGEFITSAFCLGNPHNSGYPLYVLIGKIFSMIPVGNVAFRLNLMSAFFGALTVWLTYRSTMWMTRSFVPAFSASLLLAFSATFWSQTAFAEVYTLHAFFVALIITMLMWWHSSMSFNRLLVFAFVVGLSFGNHMQTVMLAPAVFVFILWSDHKVLLNVRHFLLLTFFLALGLSVYLYLPIRTEAGTAIHWGDPDTLSRFIHHVGAGDHRHAYVLNKTWTTYGTRLLDVLKEMYSQFNIFWVFAAVGWIKQKGLKWKIFWLLIIFFDMVYTVFLNIFSLEITPFQIPSSVVAAVLIGCGLTYTLRLHFTSSVVSRIRTLCLKPVFLLSPVVLLSMNLYQNDQHANYTAHEYGINVLRSPSWGATLLVEGDNIVFPVVYFVVVENARPDLALYDRHNLFFKMPFLYRDGPTYFGKWEDLRRIIEAELVRTNTPVYMAVFNEKVTSDRKFDLIPHGVTSRAITSDKFDKAFKEETNPWPTYMTESLHDTFYRDFMNRSVTGYFFFKMGRDLVFWKMKQLGTQMFKRASSVAYNDWTLHGDLAAFYIDMGMLEEALPELRIFSQNATNFGTLHNIWGYYYSKIGNINKAIGAFKKAIGANPRQPATYNNLGLMYLTAGRLDDARDVFEKSLSLDPNQPNLITLMKTKGL
jgi:tetratricopeptide (TPR) repeat protein